VFFFVLFAVLVLSVIIRHRVVSQNILLVVLGFGMVVLVHEFGHFVVAKASGIKVEAFSMFMPPILIGIKRTEKGWRVRILPELLPKEGDENGEGLLSFTMGKKAKAGETEYRIGLIPFGGFVKMLGQDDVGPAKRSDDARSFANKPVLVRVAVLAAGVVFNALSAIAIFMIVFLAGINLPPAVVGGVVPGSAAECAGLQPGDEVIAIGGKDGGLDFSDIMMAAALSDTNEPVELRVRHADDSVEDYSLVAEQIGGEQFKIFGIMQPLTLTVARVSEPNSLFEKTGLSCGDRIRAVEGKDVEHFWEFEQVVGRSVSREVAILAERSGAGDAFRRRSSGDIELVEAKLALVYPAVLEADIEDESSLAHIYSMVPRWRIGRLGVKPPSLRERIASWFGGLGGRKGASEEKLFLEEGDIVVAVGDVENPTYPEFRKTVQQYADRELVIKVVRGGEGGGEPPMDRPAGDRQVVEITVEPKFYADVNEVLIGISLIPFADLEHAVVAKTIGGEDAPAIPRGARITAVDGVEVSSFFDVARAFNSCAGQRVSIDWRLDEEVAGDVAFTAGSPEDFIQLQPVLTADVPFERLERLYKASGPIEALKMGYKKTVWFIKTTYLTVRRLVTGLLSPELLTGPVGIMKLSYEIVSEQPPIYLLYFLGLISAVIAVFNFLPVPPLDGGLVVLLFVEKIKGSALSERAQAVIAYTGWAFVGILFIYVTLNDIARYFLGWS